MVYRLFIDESGIDDGAPVVVAAGYMARATHWQKFEKEWLPIIRRARPKISAWHASDAQNLSGEFRPGWTKEGVAEVAAKLLPIIPKYCAGAAIGIDQRDMEKALDGRPDLRRYYRDPYEMCFQWLLHIFLDRARRNNDTRRIAVVHERNDYKEIALRVFGYMSQKDDPDGLLMSMSFGDKISFPPLQAADCLAYETFRRLKNPDGKERRALTALAVDGSYLRIATYSEARGNIQRLIRMLDEMRQAHEEGRLADAARFED